MFSSIKFKVLIFTLFPLVVILLCIGILAVINKLESEQNLVVDRLSTYRSLLESGTLSFESLKDMEKLEVLLDEKVLHAEIIKKDRSVSYQTNTDTPEIRDQHLSPSIDEAFLGVETIEQIEEDGNQLLLFVTPLIVNNKVVGVLRIDLSNDQITARVTQFTLFIFILVIVGILVCYFLITALLTSSIIKNIEDLKIAATNIEQGDLETPVTSPSHDEIGELAETLEQMRKEVKNSRKQLESANKNLESQVQDRTAQLKTKLDELESLNRFMVDREVKMVELKRELEELRQKIT
jgi:HAMP domain-containing protein